MEMQNSQLIWILLCAFFVALMQVGFTMLETGATRSKNSLNTAIKNLSDFALSGLIFWAIGFGIMCGPSLYGLLGFGNFLVDADSSPEIVVRMIFQLMFCATAATIISGAVAERTSFGAYMLMTAIVTTIVYPIVGHWCWYVGETQAQSGWLNRLGFVDVAGSTVVHSLGGWCALAAILVIGPRRGRFGADGSEIPSHNLAMSTIGAFLLWIGWFGFNCGSVSSMADVPITLLNTNLAASSGSFATLLYCKWRMGQWSVLGAINGALAGLVSITASCNLVSPGAAVIIGAVGGILSSEITRRFVKWQIDDVVSAIPVHSFAGAWGTVAVALFADMSSFHSGVGRSEQFCTQTLGVAVCFGWAFGTCYLVLSVVNRFVSLRCSAEDEVQGLNISEHGAGDEVLALLNSMNRHEQQGRFNQAAYEEPHTEIGEIARHYNRVLRAFADRNEQLDEARKAAQAADQTKSEFLANMSHEIRTPMTAILGYSDLLLEQEHITDAPKERIDTIRTIQRNSNHLLGVINDILDFSKVDSGKMTTESIEASPHQILENVASLMRVRADEKQLAFQVDFITEIPKVIFTDPTRLSQILLNLASNAIKFTEHGVVRLEASFHRDSHRLQIEVVDSGIGMTDEQRARIFNPFEQADASTTRKYGGTGLGLVISQRLAELLRGELSIVHSAPGQGSTFRLSIAATTPADVEFCKELTKEEVVDCERETQPTGIADKLAGLSILLAEDGEDNQRLIGYILQKAGAVVTIVGNGKEAYDEALRALRSGSPYEVVLMDMQMPIMDGYTAVKKLRKDGYDRPIVALTANTMIGDRERCIAAGCTDFASKPIDRVHLVRTILAQLEAATEAST